MATMARLGDGMKPADSPDPALTLPTTHISASPQGDPGLARLGRRGCARRVGAAHWLAGTDSHSPRVRSTIVCGWGGAAGLAIVLYAVIGCSRLPTGPRTFPAEGLDPPLLNFGAVDDSPTWSHDGKWIAYHRGYADRAGPAGVYIINSRGGTPRLIIRGDYLGPSELRFSPDDRQLVGSWALHFVLIDVATGTWREPFRTESGVGVPDWSPDGRQIVYRRQFWPPDTPLDSAGFHIYEPATGRDRVLRVGPDVLWGEAPRWSPDGRAITFWNETAVGVAADLKLLSLKDSSVVTLATSAEGLLIDAPQWYWRQSAGILGVLFTETGRPPNQTYLLQADGTHYLPWHFLLGHYDAISPDGSMLALIRGQSSDSVGVLFTRSVDDPTGITRRQLTKWEPN